MSATGQSWGVLSEEDYCLVDEMNAIVLSEVQRVAPDTYQEFLDGFRGLPEDSTIFARMDGLERIFAERAHILQIQGLIPDFFALREMAWNNLQTRI